MQLDISSTGGRLGGATPRLLSLRRRTSIIGCKKAGYDRGDPNYVATFPLPGQDKSPVADSIKSRLFVEGGFFCSGGSLTAEETRAWMERILFIRG